jgi:hypothetical protein
MARRHKQSNRDQRSFAGDDRFGFNPDYGQSRQGLAGTDVHGSARDRGYNRAANFRGVTYQQDSYWAIPSPGPHVGRGPRGYQRPDHRIREDINDRLTQHGRLDATNIIVEVHNGEVTLKGFVTNQRARRLAEEVALSVAGVQDTLNELRLKGREQNRELSPLRQEEHHEETEQRENGQRRKKRA